MNIEKSRILPVSIAVGMFAIAFANPPATTDVDKVSGESIPPAGTDPPYTTETWIGNQILGKSDKIVIRSIPQGDIEFEGTDLPEVVKLLTSCISDEWSVDKVLVKGNEMWLLQVECLIELDGGDKGASDKYRLLARFPICEKNCKNGWPSLVAVCKFLASKPDDKWLVRRHMESTWPHFFDDKKTTDQEKVVDDPEER